MEERVLNALPRERVGAAAAGSQPLESLSASLASAELDDTAICCVLSLIASRALGDAAVVRLVQGGDRSLVPVAVDDADPAAAATVRHVMNTIPVSASAANPYAETLRTGRARPSAAPS